jgi:hypothetical protein
MIEIYAIIVIVVSGIMGFLMLMKENKMNNCKDCSHADKTAKTNLYKCDFIGKPVTYDYSCKHYKNKILKVKK